jgi:hypothetical protein
LKKRTQSKFMNKINQKALTARDFINCCDDKIMVPKLRYSENMMRWCNVLVFSVVVLINIASINCIATRHVEGECLVNFFLIIIFLFGERN